MHLACSDMLALGTSQLAGCLGQVAVVSGQARVELLAPGTGSRLVILGIAQLVRGSRWEELMNREVRKLKLAVGSEEDPGTEQDAGAASWRGTDDGFMGDVLEERHTAGQV